jgi:sterol desaturase/sphingolipid hydroxylase (fatty acid hydroxylase superfamily)
MTRGGREHAERIRLFRSDSLERLTTISHRGFALIWASVLGIVLWLAWGAAGIMASIGLVAFGLLIWTLFEYALHRFVFHWETRWKVARAVVFVVHTNHHAMPDDPGRSLMPPIISVPLASAVWVGFLLAFGAAGSLPFLGFIAGYVAYDGIHHTCHHFPMRGPVFRALKSHHLRHHHARQDGNFAITAIFWDRIFGTRILIKGH